MEIRYTAQVHVYYLVLNTFGRCEDCQIVTISDSREKLVDFYESQLLEEKLRVRDELGYLHSFKEGALYYYNPCNIDMIGSYGEGIQEQWVDESLFYEIRRKYFYID